MKHNIEIKYDGQYPNLCSGHLIVIVDGVKYDFGSYCLCSGGSVSFDEDWNEDVTQGEWSVEYPKDFPEELKEEVLMAINREIRWGCCGGCV